MEIGYDMNSNKNHGNNNEAIVNRTSTGTVSDNITNVQHQQLQQVESSLMKQRGHYHPTTNTNIESDSGSSTIPATSSTNSKLETSTLLS